MADLNFETGGVYYDLYFPALKPVDRAIRKVRATDSSSFYHYEPGNGTRYEVIFTAYNAGFGPEVVMTLVNFRKAMVITGPMFSPSQIGYMKEKLDMGEGDCYALMPLINHYLEELGQ